LGKRTKVDSVRVYWPGVHANTEEWADLAIDKEHLLRQSNRY